jgi:uncharacterized protein (TIGR03437 family)
MERLAKLVISSSILLWAVAQCHGQAGIITTVAGGGTVTGPAANGGSATNVKLGNPLSVGTDSAGNLYVVDGSAFRVWKVSPSGTITTAAGGGGSSADGVQATSAQLFPTGVTADSAGNLYISGNVLRKVTPAGIISTVAQVNGGNVAVDGAGNLYVADGLHSKILKVDLAGNITTLVGDAGSGFSGDGGPAANARVSVPQGVAADSAGNVYFCDSGNTRVRKIDTSGTITTVAGNGTPLSLGDGGPATKAGMIPTFVAVDRDGNLYIADTGASLIRKVNTAGIISTVAGGAPPSNPNFGDGGPATSAWLSGPGSVAVDSAGNIYIGDDHNFRVRKVSSGASGSPVQVSASTLSFSYTVGAPAPPSQTVVITSPGASLTFTAAPSTTSGGNWLSVTPTSGNVNNTLTISVNPASLAPGAYNGTITITPSGAGNAPQTISVRLTVTGATSSAIITTVAGNGLIPFSGGGGAATSTPMAASGVAVDRNGNLYIADVVSNRVLKVSSAGTVTLLAGNGAITFAGDGGPAANASFFDPMSVAVDASGNVYIADSINNRVRKVNPSGTISAVAGNGSSSFSGDGGPATSDGLSTPIAVAVDGSGNLYIADEGNNRVRKVNPSGTITTIAGSTFPGFSGDGGPAVGAGISLPGGLAVDAAGNVYFSDINNYRIRKVSASGTITTVAGNGTKGFSGDGGPATSAALNLSTAHDGLAVDSAGNLYVPDAANNRVRKVDSAGTITTIAGNGIAGFSGDGSPATAAGLNSPNDVAVDASGNLFIADTSNNRVRKVAAASGPATPSISANGIVNGASFAPGIAADSWATIYGNNLSTVTDTWDNAIVNGQLPTTLDGVKVAVNGKPAYVYFVSPGQINILAPDIDPGSAQVIVTNSAGTSSTFTVAASQYGPAFFSWPGNQPVATHQDFSFAARSDTFAGATTVPAKPGDVIILWGTGLGPTTPAAPVGMQVPGGSTYSTTSLPVVKINNVNATVYGAALAPGFSGLYQVAIQVPTSLADGDWPLVTTAGGATSPAVVLSVRK